MVSFCPKLERFQTPPPPPPAPAAVGSGSWRKPVPGVPGLGAALVPRVRIGSTPCPWLLPGFATSFLGSNPTAPEPLAAPPVVIASTHRSREERWAPQLC